MMHKPPSRVFLTDSDYRQIRSEFDHACPRDHLFFEEILARDKMLNQKIDTLIYREVRKFNGASDYPIPVFTSVTKEKIIPPAEDHVPKLGRKTVRNDLLEESDEGHVLAKELQNEDFELERFDFDAAALRHWNCQAGEDLLHKAAAILHARRADTAVFHAIDKFVDGCHIHIRGMQTFGKDDDLSSCTFIAIYLFINGTKDDIDEELKGFLHYLYDGNTGGNALAERYQKDFEALKKDLKWRDEYMKLSALEKERIAERIVYGESQREEGRKSTQNNIALNMLADNEPVEKIQRYTGLSINEIHKLNQ